jgi:TP901 family phage tail tape measure protein
MANTEKIVVQVVVQGDKDLKKLEGRTKSTTKSFGKMAAGVLGAVAAFKAVANVVGSAIKSFRDFEFQMAKVKAVTGASNSDFKKLSSSAKELGRTTFFTATQVAELQTNYAKLGFTTSEILDAQNATLDLATATGSDLARAAIVAGSAVRGFGLDASETQRVVDVMAVSFTSSALDIEKFQTSMTKVAPIAKSAGFSIEDTTAIMAQLSDSGIEASIAGTSLRNILLKMQDPNSDLVKSFGKTIHSLDELTPALAKFSEEGGSLAEIMEVVDLRQAAAFEQMITSRERTVNLRDSLLDANGAAKEMAEIVGENMEGAFKRFTSALEGLAINITEGFIGKAVTSFLENVTGILTFVNEFIDTSKTLDEVTAETAGSLLKESKELQNLANEYDTLNSKIDKNTSDRIRMASILDTLETRLGDSVVAIDKETGSLKLNRDALDDVIKRTALLANDEAIKLVHSIRNTEKAIKKQTTVVDKNVDSLRTQNLQLGELQKSEKQRFKEQQVFLNGVQNMIDSEDEFIGVKKEAVVVNKATAEQQKVVNKLKDKDKKLTSELNTLNEKRSEQINLLLEQGFTMAQVEALMTEEVEKGTEITNKSTTAITENTNAKIKNTAQDLVNRRNLQIEVGLQQQLLDGKITQQEFDDEFTRLKIKNIQSVLDNEVLTHPERMQLIRERNALQLKGINDEVIARQEQIDGVAQLGTQLINLAGEDKKMQGIKKAGIALSSAAAIANNIQALSEMSLGVASQSKLLFPANIIGMVTTLSTIMSLFANIKAMKGAFGDGGIVETFANGGMVHGKSHAQGGENFAVGGRVVELEGGEAVINKRSTAMFSSQLSAMNAAGGGVKFADGGLLNQPSFSQQQFNALGQNQMMGAMGGSSKVVVVEADITDSQNAVSVIQSQATI